MNFWLWAQLQAQIQHFTSLSGAGEVCGHCQGQEGKYLFSFLFQLLCLHALLYLRQQGRAGCVEILETSLLAELFYLPLQLPVGQPHLLELHLALVQLPKKIKQAEETVLVEVIWTG